jgi:hypothetical protein
MFGCSSHIRSNNGRAHSFAVEVGEVRKRHRSPALVEPAREQSLPNNSDRLKVEQLWRDETFTLKTFTSAVAVYVIVRERDHRRLTGVPVFANRLASKAK